MSGRKVSQAELIREAREELERTIKECRTLADEAARLGRDVDAAVARTGGLADAREYVPDLAAQCEALAQTCAVEREQVEQRLKSIVAHGRSTTDRRAAAEAARAERRAVQVSLEKLRVGAAAFAGVAAAVVSALPKAKDARLLAWVDQLAALQALAGELRSRRLRGELDGAGGGAGTLARDLDQAVEAGSVLPDGRLRELTKRLATLVDSSWEAEGALQTQLEVVDRVVAAASEMGFKAEPLRQRDGVMIISGKSGDVRLSGQVDSQGGIAWDAQVETDGTSAPTCARDLDGVVAAALEKDLALTGFYAVDGAQRRPVRLASARKAEAALEEDRRGRAKKAGAVSKAKKAASGSSGSPARRQTRDGS